MRAAHCCFMQVDGGVLSARVRWGSTAFKGHEGVSREGIMVEYVQQREDCVQRP